MVWHNGEYMTKFIKHIFSTPLGPEGLNIILPDKPFPMTRWRRKIYVCSAPEVCCFVYNWLTWPSPASSRWSNVGWTGGTSSRQKSWSSAPYQILQCSTADSLHNKIKHWIILSCPAFRYYLPLRILLIDIVKKRQHRYKRNSYLSKDDFHLCSPAKLNNFAFF